MTTLNKKKIQVIMRAINSKLNSTEVDEILLTINGISIFFRKKDSVSFDYSTLQVWCADLKTSTVFIALNDIKTIVLNGRTITFE